MEDPALDEVRRLLRSLSSATGDERLAALDDAAAARITPHDDVERWADCGAMTLTGPADGPSLAPAAPVASRLAGAGAVLAALTADSGHQVDVDAAALLGERAALRGLRRQGRVSAGGGCRLLRAGDGWVAVSLNRAADWDLVPAWLGVDGGEWDAVAAAVATETAHDLASRAGELGLAVAAAPGGEVPTDEQWRSRHPDPADGGPWAITRPATPTEPRTAESVRVVDLSALWAGPLCASLLGVSGADVVTVESTNRPDGARQGDPDLYRLLHQGSSLVRLDLHDAAGRAELCRLIDAADVVVTAARPRALEHLGLHPMDAVERRAGLTWVAISGYGSTGPWCNRVAYGDDAAVAGGLLLRDPQPMFCGDAIADPTTGLYAALAALAVSRSGGGLVDIALREVAAHLARPPHPATSAANEGLRVRPPRARSSVAA